MRVDHGSRRQDEQGAHRGRLGSERIVRGSAATPAAAQGEQSGKRTQREDWPQPLAVHRIRRHEEVLDDDVLKIFMRLADLDVATSIYATLLRLKSKFRADASSFGGRSMPRPFRGSNRLPRCNNLASMNGHACPCVALLRPGADSRL